MVDSTDLEQRETEQEEPAKKPPVEIDTKDDFSKHSDITNEVQELSSEAELKAVEAEKKYIKATYAFDKNDIDEALMLIRSALALCPGNAKYHYNIGFLYWRKDLIEVALNHYKLFVRYAPADHKELQNIKDRIRFFENEIQKRRHRK